MTESDKEAVRNAALEEAIAICEKYRGTDFGKAAECISDFIQGLKSQPAQPSDTEMLDWLIDKEYAIRLMSGGYDLFDTDSGEWLDVDSPTPREAIKAAMRAERGGK